MLKTVNLSLAHVVGLLLFVSVKSVSWATNKLNVAVVVFCMDAWMSTFSILIEL